MDLPKPLPIDTELDEFKLIEVIWRTSVGTLYRALDLHSSQTVALYSFPPLISQDPILGDQLSSHIQKLSTLKHPNIVTISELRESENGFFLVHDFVRGIRLDQYMAKKGPLDTALTLRFMRHLLSGLEVAHNAGCLHKSLNPSHIVISRGNIVKILHFGVIDLILRRGYLNPEKATNKTDALYLSPEQQSSIFTADQTTDIYAVGIIGHQMLTGQSPIPDYNRSTNRDSSLINNRIKDLESLDPPPHQDLIQAISTALARSSVYRFQSATEMLDVLKDLRVNDVQPNVEYHSRPFARSFMTSLRNYRVLFSFFGMVLCGVLMFFFLRSHMQNPYLALADDALLISNSSQQPPPSVQVNQSALLILDINPYGNVYLDGVMLAKESIGRDTFEISKQPHVLSVIHPEFGKWEQQIDVTEKNLFSVLINFQERIPLKISARNEDDQSVRGEIFIDGISTNMYTPATLEIPVGMHTFEVQARNYRTLMPPPKINITRENSAPIKIMLERLEDL